MTFIWIFVAVILVRLHGDLPWIQRDRWFEHWCARLEQLGGGFALAVSLPVVALFAALWLLDRLGWTLVAQILSFLGLLYACGRGHLQERVERFIGDLTRDDLQAAYHDASALRRDRRESGAENWHQLHRETLGVVAYRYFEHFFPPIFWFACLGAPGAVLYRLVWLHFDKPGGAAQTAEAARALTLLEWLPLRLLGFTLALMGHFGATIERWRRSLTVTGSSREVVADYIQAALQSGGGPDNPAREIQELRELSGLVDRCLVTWLALLALLVILL